MSLSGDTLIREIRGKFEEEAQTPRVLDIDDWAKRRGRTYGSILADLELRQPVELLDSRKAADVAAWLKQYPGIEIVSSDRGNEYIKVVCWGAPHVQQSADCWHLLKNLREVILVSHGARWINIWQQIPARCTHAAVCSPAC